MSPKWKGLEIPTGVVTDEKAATPTYGKFIAEPFERGFAITVGHSLRRILISSIQGAAVTGVQFDSVMHEFSTIPGVVEDVTEIILNLKRLIIKLEGAKSKTLYVEEEGPKAITAASIVKDEHAVVLNPDLHLATLNKEAKFKARIEVGRGYGYVTSEQNKKEGSSIGFIPVDSTFSPVTKVKYNIENTRIGHRTDYERLILEIFTNGTVSPEQALVHAADILRKHVEIFITFESEEEEPLVELSEEEKKRREYLCMNVSELELSVRSSNCLKAAGIKTISQLVQKTEADMLKYRNFGKKSLSEINKILTSMKLSLGMTLDPALLKELEGGKK
jgi:DNA-directed RNA polymerase subunit alpha